MAAEKYFLGENPDEVRAAMLEENCGQCFGCHDATLLAAEIVNRTNLLLYFTDRVWGIYETQQRLEQAIDKKRQELVELTFLCNGDCIKDLISSTHRSK